VRVTALILMTTFPVSLAAQHHDGDSTRHWRVSVQMEAGRAIGRTGTDLAKQLSEAGYDGSTPGGCFFGFCSGPTSHPQVTKPGVIAGFSIRGALSRSVSIGAGFSRGVLGGADGFQPLSSTGDIGNYVFSDWEAKDYWLAAYWTPHPTLRFGVGPGWYRVFNGTSGQHVQRVGAMAEAAVQTNGRLFVDFAARYHAVPGGAVEDRGLTMQPKFSHATLTAGFGVHF